MPRRRKSNYVDVSGFGTVVKQLSRMSGKDFDTVLKAEVGHVLKGAISRTPISSIKGRKSRGKVRGGVVPYNMPETMTLQGGVGNKLITKQDGKYYHAGLPKVLIKYSDERGFKKFPQKGVGRGKGVHPKRGGTVYSKPFPKQAWLGRSKFWGQFVPEKIAQTERKIKRIGMGAGQFYWMAKDLGIIMPGRVKGKKQISSGNVRSLVSRFIKPKKKESRFGLEILLESKGMKVSSYTQAAMRLNQAAGARIKFFQRAVKKGFINDFKGYMPKNYPLIFK